MLEGKFKFVVFLAGILFFALTNASPQQIQPRSQQSARSAEGPLAVTATVVSSSGVVIGPDGQQHTIVANAVDEKDSAPTWQPEPAVKVVTLSPVTEQKPDAKPEPTQPQKP